MKVYLNGDIVDKKNARVSVFDHGFLYGDGVFEGIRSYSGVVFKLDEHIDRLYESAHSIMIDVSLTKKQLTKSIIDTLKANKLKDGYIRVIVTRGAGDLGLNPKKCKGNSSIIIITDKITLYPQMLYKKGMEIITVPTPRNVSEAVNPLIKSMNYLNNILAKIEANNSGYSEAIILDHQGFVAECTGDNIFIVKKGQLSTPANGCLKGITRDTVIELAREEKMKTHECSITRHEIFVAEECFLTGTAAEIIPVVKVDGRAIGNGRPGPVTVKLIKKYHNLTTKNGVKYTV